MFKLDTMLYPFSAVTAIMYMVVTMFFVISNEVNFLSRVGFPDTVSTSASAHIGCRVDTSWFQAKQRQFAVFFTHWIHVLRLHFPSLFPVPLPHQSLLYWRFPFSSTNTLVDINADLQTLIGAVSANDVWRAQEIWFSYAFCSLVGVIDAFYQKLTSVVFYSRSHVLKLTLLNAVERHCSHGVTLEQRLTPIGWR